MNTVSKTFIISALAAAVAITPLTSAVAEADGMPQKSSADVKKPAATQKPPVAKKPAARDERAIGALRTMGEFLREQKKFSVSTATETDYVTDTGQKITVSAQGKLDVERPDKLRAELTSDRKDRQFFYDGKTFTIFSPKLGFYSTVDAPPTIGELADVLQARFGLELPMVDLFRWGDPNADFSEITLAQYVGPAKIDGAETEQYTFRQKGVDWQIWIERGDKPVPRKLALTTTDSAARPQFAIAMKWSLDAKHSGARFSFEPPKNSAQIALAELAPQPEIENTTRAKRSAPRADER